MPATSPNRGQIALLVGTRKGAFVIEGDASRRAWKSPRGIMIGSIVNHIAMDPRDRRTILMTARTGHLGPTIFRSQDLGETWSEASRPPAFPKAAAGETGLVLSHNFWLSPGHPDEPRVWYLGSSPPGLFRSDDGGDSWEPVPGFNEHPKWGTRAVGEEGPPDGSTVHSIMVDPRDSSHIYLCLSDGAAGGVFETTDRGSNWHPLNRGLQSDFLPDPDAETGHDPHCMRMHPLNPDRLYQQSHSGIYRMDRATGSWERIGLNLPKENDISDYSFPIVLHPQDADTAWVMPLDG
ncbi:MAG TPA: glycosyl hydrolase, partial [Chloroflexota bacterium]